MTPASILRAARRRWVESPLSADEFERKRRACAETLRERFTERQRAFATSAARVRASDKSRRAGGTETIGCEVLARCIEHDGYVAVVFGETLDTLSRNWWHRLGGTDGDGEDGGIAKLRALGFRPPAKGRRWTAGRLEYHEVTDSEGSTKAIRFPWGSGIIVCGADDERKVRKLRGVRANLWWGDECQNLVHVLTLLKEVAAAAGSERRAETVLTGTPSEDVDSFFAQASQGLLDGVEAHHFYGYDNPVFGETFEERYRAAVIETIRANRALYNVTEEQIAALARITREEAEALGRQPAAELPGAVNENRSFASPSNENQWPLRRLAEEIDPVILREYFGRWVGARELYVYAARFVPAELLYWASATTPLELRVEQLPRAPTVGTATRLKVWRAVVSSDIGAGAEKPGGLVALLHSREDPAVYEIHSEWLSAGLGEDQQFEAAARLCVELDGLGIAIDVLLFDPGGQGQAIGRSWAARLTARLNAYGFRGEVPPVRAALKDGRKEADILLLNADMRRGHLRCLHGSPLDVEQRALQWRRRDSMGQPLREDVDRQVPGPDGRVIRPGNDCCDARLYGWRHCVYVLRGQSPTAKLVPGSDAAIEARGERIRAEAARRASRSRRHR